MSDVLHATDGTRIEARTDRGILPWIVGVLGIVAVALAIWLGMLLTAEPELGASGEIQSLVDDYISAAEAGEAEGLAAILTEDFSADLTFDWIVTPGYAPLDDADTRDQLLEEIDVRYFDPQLARVSRLAVTGDGPWFVADVEEWELFDYRLHQGSIYVVTEEEGRLLLDRKWVIGAQLELPED
ncbi:MAG TPA: hypothetical protein VLG28_08370 [Acidimicrobiia bacterium]|jgi:hypothetical protein|nr:hypothetical protein [Acidimicrobiia bacterium]